MGSGSSCEQPNEIPEKDRDGVLCGRVSLEGIADFIKKRISEQKRMKIAIIMGAGASVSAGIPDFRSPGTGLYDNLEKYNLPTAESIFTLSYFRDNPEPFCKLASELFPGSFEPTLVHFFIRLLQNKRMLHRCLTQNIDNLERLAGVSDKYLVEAHGSFASAGCIDCKEKWTLGHYKNKVAGGKIPRCEAVYPVAHPKQPSKIPGEHELKEAEEEKEKAMKSLDMSALLSASMRVSDLKSNIEQAKKEHAEYPAKVAQYNKGPKEAVCSGLVKPDIVFFGESLPKLFHDSLEELEAGADLAIILGTSLQVAPFSTTISKVSVLCPRLLINREPVALFEAAGNSAGFRFGLPDNYRDVHFGGDCDAGVMRLCELLGWQKELLALKSAYRKPSSDDALAAALGSITLKEKSKGEKSSRPDPKK